MNYLKLKRFSHHLQVDFHHLCFICNRWYQLFAPDYISKRRNCKVSDSTILALLIWQAKIGIESQGRFYESLLYKLNLSRSRFNRRARQLLPVIYAIRHGLNEEVDLTDRVMILDSFPVPLCQPVRNRRVKIFRGSANIGYKATRKIYYYGFKVHALASDDGYIADYVVTKASVHDAKEAFELIANSSLPNRYYLGDEGYLGQKLHNQLKQVGYILCTPYRHNMKNAKKHNNPQLMVIRRTIDSDFNLLSYYNAESNRARSLIGFQERLEVAILTSNMAYCLERFN